jgi:flagellar P-ring protein precursor FlgI
MYLPCRLLLCRLSVLLPLGAAAAQDPVPLPAPEPAPAAVAAPLPAEPTVLHPRIRTITRPHNVMPHQLVGIGVVTGLAGTGASERATRQAVFNVVRQLGLNISPADVVAGSTALVSMTCTLPPFAKEGMLLDVKVEVLGDAVSLRGGELLRAELKGVDGQTYLVAQGSVTVAGYTAAGTNASVTKNANATGWINNGGLVVRTEHCSYFSEAGDLELQLLNPSPFNAASIAAAMRAQLAEDGLRVAVVDPALVRIQVPAEQRTEEHAILLLNRVGELRVPVENPAKVVIDQSSGTVLAGEGVLISPCVVAMSDLTIAVVDEEEVAQPLPYSKGSTERVGRTRIEVQQNDVEARPVAGGATVADLLQNLKALGLTAPQLISVFQALDNGSFLHATLEVR